MAEQQKIRVCIAGATGWAGSTLAKAVTQSADLDLVGAVSRSFSGRLLRDALGAAVGDVPVAGTAKAALLTPCDVFVEYTHHGIAKANVLQALDNGAHVVVGTSGLSDDDYVEIDRRAREHEVGVLAVGNFALTVVLLQKFAEIAAKYVRHWEIFDYAGSTKKDVPSGTVRELTNRLSQVRPAAMDVPLEQVQGEVQARGATLNGMQVHSLRLPGFVIGAEVVFGMPDQRLSIRHEAGSSSEPYVEGALLAIRKVLRLTGLHRGLDTVMDI